MKRRGPYATIIGAISIIGLMALLLQYALSGRLQSVTQYAGIDNGMRIHRRAGQMIALFFFLHPFLIILPRVAIAPQLVVDDLWLMLTSAESQTGPLRLGDNGNLGVVGSVQRQAADVL